MSDVMPGAAGPHGPDWRDPASYAYTRGLTGEAWAWEFLRRNSRYRSAYESAETTAKSAQEVDAAAAPWGLVSFRVSGH